MRWDLVAILLLLGIVAPWRSLSRVRFLLRQEVSGSERIALYLSTIVFQWGVSVLIAWRCLADGLTRENLGLLAHHPVRQITAIAAISAVLVANQIVGVRHLAARTPERRGTIGRLAEKLLPRTANEKRFAVLLVFTVAICEEFIYRGFVQGWFEALMSSAVAGAVISATFFAVAHLYQGRRGVLTTFLAGIIFSTVRIWTGSLLPSVLIHLAVDLSAGVASYRMLGSSEV